MQKSIDTVVGEQRKLRVRSYLYMKEVFENVMFHHNCKDGLNTTRHFPFKICRSISRDPFYFTGWFWGYCFKLRSWFRCI